MNKWIISKPFNKTLCILCIAVLYTSMASEASVQIYKKNRFSLEPIHIFELNTIVNQAFAFLARLIEMRKDSE